MWVLVILILLLLSKAGKPAVGNPSAQPAPKLADDPAISTGIPTDVLKELASGGFQPVAPGSSVAAADQSGHDVVSAKIHAALSDGPTIAQQQATLLGMATTLPDASFGFTGGGGTIGGDLSGFDSGGGETGGISVGAATEHFV